MPLVGFVVEDVGDDDGAGASVGPTAGFEVG